VNVTQITPQFAPEVGGVGDYAAQLGRQMWSGHGIESRFLIGDPAWSPSGGAAEFTAEAVAKRSAIGLAEKIENATRVVVHYVGYGYQSRGVPFWLTGGLERWKRSDKRHRLIAVFHELWSVGAPWRSEFYLGPVQRHLAARLHRLCDAAMTSTPAMARMLDAISPGKTTFQPIANSLPAVGLGEREWHAGGPVRVAVFGLEATRQRSVETHAALLRALHDAGLLKGVEVVGSRANAGDAPSTDVQTLFSLVPAELVRVTADVSPGEGAQRLAGADLFLSFYPSKWVCKSSAFTSALACGCVAVLPEAKFAAPLVEGRDLLACDGSAAAVARFVERIRTEPLAPIAQAGWRWRAQHAAWPATAQRIATMLCVS